MEATRSGTRRSRPPARRGGFTLLEVVVATSVLIILTLMIGSLFRQATSSWNTGRVRGEGSMIARSVLGAVARDLATAIDGRPYGFSGGPEASDGSLEFVCVKSAGARGQSVHKISYTVTPTGATRKDAVWDGDSFGPARNFTLFEIGSGESPVEEASFELVGAAAQSRSFEKNAGAKWPGATAVKLRMKLSQKGAFTGVSVRSRGKNGIEDSENGTNNDDIVVN